MSNESVEALGALSVGVVTLVYIIFMIIVSLLSLAASVVSIIALWKTFEKAGAPGWAAIVPGYNLWVGYEISCNNNILWFILSFVIPPVAMAFYCFGLAKSFGKGTGFGILCFLVPIVGFCILGFGPAVYTGEKI